LYLACLEFWKYVTYDWLVKGGAEIVILVTEDESASHTLTPAASTSIDPVSRAAALRPSFPGG